MIEVCEVDGPLLVQVNQAIPIEMGEECYLTFRAVGESSAGNALLFHPVDVAISGKSRPF